MFANVNKPQYLAVEQPQFVHVSNDIKYTQKPKEELLLLLHLTFFAYHENCVKGKVFPTYERILNFFPHPNNNNSPQSTMWNTSCFGSITLAIDYSMVVLIPKSSEDVIVWFSIEYFNY